MAAHAWSLEDVLWNPHEVRTKVRSPSVVGGLSRANDSILTGLDTRTAAAGEGCRADERRATSNYDASTGAAGRRGGTLGERGGHAARSAPPTCGVGTRTAACDVPCTRLRRPQRRGHAHLLPSHKVRPARRGRVGRGSHATACPDPPVPRWQRTSSCSDCALSTRARTRYWSTTPCSGYARRARRRGPRPQRRQRRAPVAPWGYRPLGRRRPAPDGPAPLVGRRSATCCTGLTPSRKANTRAWPSWRNTTRAAGPRTLGAAQQVLWKRHHPLLQTAQRPARAGTSALTACQWARARSMATPRARHR